MKSVPDNLFEDLKRHRVPACPDNLEAVVLRRIRHEETEKFVQWSGWNRTITYFLEPKMAAIVLFLVSSAAVVTTSVASQYAAPVEIQADTLGLEFISKPNTLECFHLRVR